MNQKILFISIGCLLFFAGAFSQQGQSGNVVFSGTTDAKFDGNKVYIYNGITKLKDSAIVKDGKFTITVPFTEPTMQMFYSEYELRVRRGFRPFGIFVTQPSKITIKANMERFAFSLVSGSKEQDLYDKFQAAESRAYKIVADEIDKKYGKEFVAKPDTADARYAAYKKDLSNVLDKYASDRISRIESFITNHPGSLASLYLFFANLTSIEQKKKEELYIVLKPDYLQTYFGKRIAANVEAGKANAIGKQATDFTLPNVSGAPVSLSSFKGKYVLIDFWASWCSPCRDENPNLLKAYTKYRDKNFEIIGVSIDTDKRSWTEAVEKDKTIWVHVSDLKGMDSEVSTLYGITAVPQNLLLDPNGKIIAKNIHKEELNKKLEELFHY